ncbi:hypothetical protein [Nocardioides daphniae]|uniref:Uncharacterized protein n=1 Tax=Nocardioides daphniae TaxID=402297 RepID=A0ABQ1PZ55_9ACTN|nr:hypothetical protein [Nocardioides daphniae]GGD07594.1 hypothetical protein GCM10007231_02890 [Nocardioides daphniae]
MDNKDSRTETCPDCGAVTAGGDHACPAAPRADDTATIAIPPGLWDTGLFKPAWNRGPDAGTPDAPLATGSLLSRPDDLTPTETPAEKTPAAPGIDSSFVVPDRLMTSSSAEEPEAEPEAAAEEPQTEEPPTEEPQAEEPQAEEPQAEAPAAWWLDEDPVDDAAEDPTDVPAEDPADGALGDTNERPALTDEAIAELDGSDADTAYAPDSDDEPADADATQFDLAATPSSHAWPTAEPSAPAAPAPLEPATTSVPVPAPTTTFVPAASSVSTATAAAPTATETAVTPTAYDTEEAPRRSRRGLAVVLTLALVAALLGGGWFWWQSSQDEPVREAFEASHGAFMNASTKLVSAESTDDLAVAGKDFEQATTLLEDTRATANGRGTKLGDAVRRAVAAQLEVSRAAQGLTGIADEQYGAWGEARGDLRSGLEALSGVEADIRTAGGSTEGLPGPALVEEIDTTVGDAATASGQRRTKRLTADLAAATRIAQLRNIGQRARTGTASLSGAVDSLDGSDVDTAGIARHAAVQEALAKMTRLRPATLNQWEAISTQVERKADEMPDGGTDLKVALTKADAMVTAAAEAWTTWETQTESARTAKQDDIEAVKTAQGIVDGLATDLEGLDTSLANFMAGGPFDSAGTAGEAYATLSAAAGARESMAGQLTGVGTPPEVEEEVAALVSALTTHAATVRAAADAAAACTPGCMLVETPGWTQLAANRESQVAAVASAVEAWREAAKEAVKEIRQRELPEKPQI